MPAVLAYGYHESNQGEYLSQFVLSALGVSTPVIRQEDIGVDFFCSLAKEENKRLTFHSPYMVQHGAVGSKEFVYGGYSDKGKWRSEGIDWLFSQELPLFVCVTDRKKGDVRLYSTSPMWLVHYHFGKVWQVEFCPDETHDPLRKSRGDRLGKEGEGDGYTYRVPLGRPIIEVNILQLEAETRNKARQALGRAIEIEQRNITFRRLGVQVASWFPNIVSNEPESLQNQAGSVFWDATSEKSINKQLESLLDMAITLSLNLNGMGDTEKLESLAPVFGLFKRGQIPEWIFGKLPEIVKKHLR